MQEATRLTREGRLEEAMAVLRGAPAPLAAQSGAKPKALASLLERMPKLDALKRGPLKPAPVIAVPDGARFEERTHAGAAGARPYKVYTPSGYAGQPLPLV